MIFLNQQGVSLIGAMASFAVSVMLILAVNVIIQNVLKSSKTQNVVQQVNDLRNTLIQITNDPNVCQSMLKDNYFLVTTASPTGGVSMPFAAPLPGVETYLSFGQLATGVKISNDLQINSISLQKVNNLLQSQFYLDKTNQFSWPVSANLTVQLNNLALQRGQAFGSQTYTIVVPVLFSLSPVSISNVLGLRIPLWDSGGRISYCITQSATGSYSFFNSGWKQSNDPGCQVIPADSDISVQCPPQTYQMSQTISTRFFFPIEKKKNYLGIKTVTCCPVASQ